MLESWSWWNSRKLGSMQPKERSRDPAQGRLIGGVLARCNIATSTLPIILDRIWILVSAWDTRRPFSEEADKSQFEFSLSAWSMKQPNLMDENTSRVLLDASEKRWKNPPENYVSSCRRFGRTMVYMRSMAVHSQIWSYRLSSKNQHMRPHCSAFFRWRCSNLILLFCTNTLTITLTSLLLSFLEIYHPCGDSSWSDSYTFVPGVEDRIKTFKKGEPIDEVESRARECTKIANY